LARFNQRQRAAFVRELVMASARRIEDESSARHRAA
jgi:hypothetical protein